MRFKTEKLGDFLYVKGRIGWKGLKKDEYLSDGVYRIINGEALTKDGIDWSKAGFISKERYEESPEIMLQNDDILISKDGTIGKLGFVRNLENPSTVASGIFVLRNLKPEMINTRFIYNYLSSVYFRNFIISRTEGSVISHLYQKDFVDLYFPLPSLKEQNKIVDVLDTISCKIEINKMINNNLEEQVSVLYQSWFEDFEITNGVCPENWSYQELSTIADIASGKRPPVKSDTCNKKTPISIVGAASVMGFTSEANHTDKILVTGRVGTHGVIQRFNTPCWTSDNTLVITSPYYEFTNQILHRIDYASMNRGSTQPLITQGDMKKVAVLVPDEDTLAKFEEFAGSLMAKWEANNNENVKLASLRDTLLPKLMSGELDVSNIDF